MKIEVLFPEFCNLFGDSANMKYLKQCLPEAEFIQTYIEQEPRFVQEDVELIYLGTMTEKMQERTIEKLLPYKARIEELIQKNVCFLFTGNAFEILGKYIENEDGSKIDGLGIFDTYAKRDMYHRYNCLVLGTFEDMKMVGFKNQFSHSYGSNEAMYFLEVEKGSGLNPESKLEGIKKNHFIGTYLLGPILVLNPLFTKYLLRTIGVENPVLAYEEDIMKAYQQRLSEFQSDKV